MGRRKSKPVHEHLYTPAGAASLAGVELSADQLARAIEAGTLRAVRIIGRDGVLACYAVTAEDARAVRRKRARAGETRAPKKLDPQAPNYERAPIGEPAWFRNRS